MPFSQLKKHFAYLKRECDIVPLRTITEMYRKTYIPDRLTVSITYDDGFANNLKYALPLHEEFRIPATFFVSSILTEKKDKILRNDFMDLVTSRKALKKFKIGEHVFERKNSSSPKDGKISLDDYIKALTNKQIEKVCEALKKQSDISELFKNIPEDYYRLLNTEELRQLASSDLVEIGSHTHSHPDLCTIPKGEVVSELTRSKKLLENALSKKIVSLAYPYGSYDEEVKKLSLEAGYKNLYAVSYCSDTDKNDKTILSRHCISNTTTFEANMILLRKALGKVGF